MTPTTTVMDQRRITAPDIDTRRVAYEELLSIYNKTRSLGVKFQIAGALGFPKLAVLRQLVFG